MKDLIISGANIRVNDQGLFCINDLHKASGGEIKSRPSDWIKLHPVQSMIEILLTKGYPSVKTVEGRYGGTYVCKELVYSYAMWVSGEFALHVIRTFDSLSTGESLSADAQEYMRLEDAIAGAKREQVKIKDRLRKLGLEPINNLDYRGVSERESAVARLVGEHGVKAAKEMFVKHSDAPTPEAARKRFERSLIKCKESGLI